MKELDAVGGGWWLVNVAIGEMWSAGARNHLKDITGMLGRAVAARLIENCISRLSRD